MWMFLVRTSAINGLSTSVVELLIYGTPMAITEDYSMSEMVQDEVGMVVSYDEKQITVVQKHKKTIS